MVLKKRIIVLGAILSLMACKDKEQNYASFGEEFDDDHSLAVADIRKEYDEMKSGDTLEVKFTAKVDDVCQAKGCWMKLNLENGEQVMVKFKDYGFFVPKDIAGKEVVVNGKAFVDEMSVEDQKHYAADAGKTEAEIAAITAPKKTLSFEADGVLLKN